MISDKYCMMHYYRLNHQAVYLTVNMLMHQMLSSYRCKQHILSDIQYFAGVGVGLLTLLNNCTKFDNYTFLLHLQDNRFCFTQS